MGSTEVAKAGANGGLPSTDLVGSWGEQKINAANIILPRVLLMQGQSEFVLGRKAQIGDIVKSTTGQVVAGVDKAVEFIPLWHVELWSLLEKVGNKFEWRRNEAVTADNLSAPLQFNYQGTEWRRDKCLDFFVILVDDIAKEKAARDAIAKGELPSIDSALFPCYLSFRRTSTGAGKELVKAFATAKHYDMPVSRWKFKLTSKMDKNDQGTYAVFEVANAGTTDLTHLPVCKSWFDVITSQKAKVHEPEEMAAKEAKPVNEATSKF